MTCLIYLAYVDLDEAGQLFGECFGFFRSYSLKGFGLGMVVVVVVGCCTPDLTMQVILD